MTEKQWLNLLFNTPVKLDPETTKELLELYYDER